MTKIFKIGFIAALLAAIFFTGCGTVDTNSTEYNGGRLFEDNKGELTFFFKSLDVSGLNGRDVTENYFITLKTFNTDNFTDKGELLKNNYQYEGSEGPFMLSLLNKKLNKSFSFQFSEHFEKVQFFGPNIRKEFKDAKIVKNENNATVYKPGLDFELLFFNLEDTEKEELPTISEEPKK